MIKINKNRPVKGKHSCSIILIIVMLMVLSSFTLLMTHSVDHSEHPHIPETTKNTKDVVVLLPHQVTEPSSLPLVNKPPEGQSHTSVTATSPLPPVVVTINPPPPTNILLRQDPKQPFQLHFMHIPKCGGTSMTAVLREVMCDMAPDRMKDCCTNPGFCDTRAMRRCSAIKGCVNHFANRPFIFKPEVPSITIMRHPVSRLVSAWFYRCHSPNSDCFQVRPEFKLIKQKKKPKAIFPEYLEMTEYNNILTRMLGAGSFPYKDVNITEKIFKQAVDALDHMFFVGLQEAYSLSVEVMLRELGSKVKPKIKKERQDVSKKMAKNKLDVTTNTTLMDRAAAVNSYDIRLYDKAREKFCHTLEKYPDLMAKLDTRKVTC